MGVGATPHNPDGGGEVAPDTHLRVVLSAVLSGGVRVTTMTSGTAVVVVANKNGSAVTYRNGAV